MAVQAMDSLPPAAIEALGQWKLETIISVGVIVLAGLGLWLLARVYERRLDAKKDAALDAAKTKRARMYTEAMSSMALSVDNLRVSTDSQSMILGRLETASSENTQAVRTLLATLKGSINAADSRKIIEAEFWSLAKECVRAYQVSLRENHFKGREEHVEKKLKRGTTKLFDRAFAKLKQFDMAVSPDYYFARTADKTRWSMVDAMWILIVPLYRKPANYNVHREALDRDQVVLDSIMAYFREELIKANVRADAEYRTGITDSGIHRPAPKPGSLDDSDIRPSLPDEPRSDEDSGYGEPR